MSQTVSKSVIPNNPAFNIPLLKTRGISEIHVTPEMAQHWLTFNTANRGLTREKVNQFRDDMLTGKWNDDGATIRFAPGKLLDGQHRLHAIIESGTKPKMIIVYGLQSQCQVTMDTGRSRTPRDVLSIEGLDTWDAQVIGAGLHTVIAYQRGLPLYASTKSTNHEIRDYYLEHSTRLGHSIARVKAYPRRHPVLAHSRVLALHYLLALRDETKADEFFDRLMTGEGLAKSSPIYILRNRLQADALDKRHRSAFELLAFVIKAWNGYVRGAHWKTDNAIRVTHGDDFPEIA